MDSGHDYYVLDLQYSYHGKRFASCSSDHSIRIWDQEGGVWKQSAKILKASRSAVSKLSWAFPEYGQLLAACSEDSSVTIWEEQTETGTTSGVEDAVSGGNTNQQQGSRGSKWICRATLKESVRAVKDVEFAPRHLGLKLASCGADGFVRIYEAVDVMNLSHWPHQDTFEAERGQGDVALSLSWNKSRFDPPTLVVGGNTVKVWQFDDASRKWDAICVLGQSRDSPGVHDVSWAPKMGRSYHMIATAGRDYKLRIDYLHYADRGQLVHSSEDTKEIDVKSEVWRVEWNVTGTLLASSGGDGILKLWKRGYEGTGSDDWMLVKTITQGQDAMFPLSGE